MSLSKAFSSCHFSPVVKNKAGDSTTILPSPIGTWKTTSFFLDSSGRSSFALPLELKFTSKEDLDLFLTARCIHPSPSNLVRDEKEDESTVQGDDNSQQTESLVGFEVKSYSVDETKAVVVEGIKVLSSSVEGESIFFQADITVRATSHRWVEVSPHTDRRGGRGEKQYSLDIQSNLEVTPVLTERKLVRERENLDVPDLLSLELGTIPSFMHKKESSVRLHETRLSSIALNVTLTHAFTIAIHSVPGPTVGSTFVSLTIRHSNTHAEPVSITNIALHPGHSRQESASESTKGQYSVSKCERCSFYLNSLLVAKIHAPFRFQ